MPLSKLGFYLLAGIALAASSPATPAAAAPGDRHAAQPTVARAPARSGSTVTLSGNTRWASGVVALSSQYSDVEWSAAQALGYPDTYPVYGDLATAWGSLTPDDQREFLELSYDNPAPINYVIAVETFNPGAIDSIYVMNPHTSEYELVWTAPASPAAEEAHFSVIQFATTPYPVSRVRIAINSPAVPGWNEIDAVGIGSGGAGFHFFSSQWASNQEESSSVDPYSSWATGPPDVYPAYGDNVYAWASSTPDGSREWLQLRYFWRELPPGPISGVDVYQTFNPGAVDSIYIRNALDDSLNLVYSALPAALPASATVLGVRFPMTSYPVDGVRITLASDVVPGFNEIDAVAITRDTLIFIPDLAHVPPSAPAFTGLESAVPNPFVESARIGFVLAREASVRLEIYDVRGRRVNTIASGTLAAGAHTRIWRGDDERGKRVEPGIYFARLSAGGLNQTRRIVRLR